MLPVIALLSRRYQHRRLTKHLSTNVLRRIGKLILYLLILVAINTLGMLIFEKMRIDDALWLSFTTVTTVGYGDYSPSTAAGRIVTIVTMYCFAISLLSLLVAEVVEGRMIMTEKKRKGLWKFKHMKDHIQIINVPDEDAERFLLRLVKQIRITPSLQDLPIQLLTRKYPEGLPASLSDVKIIHRTGSGGDKQVLDDMNLEHAKHIVILAQDAHDSLSDSISFDILSQVAKKNTNATIVVEAVLDDNRERFFEVGANAVIRPIRAYPEMISRAMADPGTEQILEDLFSIHGDSLAKVPCQFSNCSWKKIIEVCVELKIGTPMGYFEDNKLTTHPDFDQSCTGEALVILAKCHQDIDQKALENALK